MPLPVVASLAGYTVAIITRLEALPLILKYEWLALSATPACLSACSPRVASYRASPGSVTALVPPRSDPLSVRLALCLERGGCVHWAPRNAASFLISRAVKLIHRTKRIARFFAYADPAAGEYGAVYQAANWNYLGQGLHGTRGERRTRRYCLPPGADPDNPRN